MVNSHHYFKLFHSCVILNLRDQKKKMNKKNYFIIGVKTTIIGKKKTVQKKIISKIKRYLL